MLCSRRDSKTAGLCEFARRARRAPRGAGCEKFPSGNLLVAESLTTHMLKKIGSKWVVFSETTGRKMGSYKTKKEAKKRLRQIEFFKHLKGSPSLRGKLRKKSLLK